MKTIRLLSLVLLAVAFTALPALAQKTRAQIAAEIAANLPDNNAGAITPAILRTTLSDISLAAPNTADGDVTAAIASAFANSPVFAGIPTAPTAAMSTNTTQIATTAFVLANGGGGGSATWGSITGTLSSQTDLNTALGLKATVASPTFTGTPAAPTAAVGTNTTQLATTAYVRANPSGPTVVSPAFSSTLATDASQAPNGSALVVQVGTLTGNIILSNPTNPVNRQKLEFVLKQDGTGGWTLTLGSKYRFPSSSALTSPITVANSPDFVVASKKTRMLCEYDEADDKWDLVAFVPGY